MFILIFLPACTSSSSSPALQSQIDDNLRRSRPVQALYAIERLAHEQGWTPALAAQAGDIYRDLGDLSSAVAVWERIPNPNAVVLRDLARAQLVLGRWDNALATLHLVIAQTPDDAWAHWHSALLQAPVDPQAALATLPIAATDPAYTPIVAALQETLTGVQNDTLLPMRVGIVLADHGQWRYAERAFARAAALNAPYAEALAYLGVARVMQGKDGAQVMLQAVALEPVNARIRYLQGIYLRAIGDARGAIDSLGQAAALAPDTPLYFVELAQAYRDLRDLQQAEYWLRVAVAVSGNAPRFLEILALFYADEAENLTVDGVAALEQAISLLPADPDIYAGYGWAIYLTGDRERGLSLIDQALSSDADNPRALYYRGRILLDSGDTDAALPLLEQVASGTSEFAPIARALLESLRG
ncbi:MAG: tetratricopeptide repeat protein [Chloroflexota bacterium]|nr:tetratricopeptide repeat protein [Chloroflexota bacterium]